MPFTEMPIVRRVPHLTIFKELLAGGLIAAGGFPLWLVGGADSYGDIDLYAVRRSDFIYWPLRLREWGFDPKGRSPETIQMYDRVEGKLWQIVRPAPHQLTVQDILASTDLTASAVGLVMDKGTLRAYAQYPDDIAKRECRILVQHAWTDFRVKAYQEKGYKFV